MPTCDAAITSSIIADYLNIPCSLAYNTGERGPGLVFVSHGPGSGAIGEELSAQVVSLPKIYTEIVQSRELIEMVSLMFTSSGFKTRYTVLYFGIR